MRDGDTEYLLGSRETMNTPPKKKKIKPDLHQSQQ